MKSIRTITSALLLAAFMISTGFSDESAAPATVAPPKELKPQTVCPVMGKPIDSSSYTDIQGQRVYHCCAGCTEKLVADPDKYFKQAAAEGVLFENIQKTCPVSGEALEGKDVYSDYEGRRVYFCCAKCQKKFATDPQKYLKAMDAPAKGLELIKEESHGGH